MARSYADSRNVLIDGYCLLLTIGSLSSGRM